MRLKDDYIAAKCCRPAPGDDITGYFSHDNIIKVHRSDCANLNGIDPERLLDLNWDDILDEAPFQPGHDYSELDEVDFMIMKHHRDMGVDYSLKVAKVLYIDKQTVFDRHNKLRNLEILQRVEPRIIRYRKGIVKNKWIKHRNHTYYDLTDKGNQYLDFYLG